MAFPADLLHIVAISNIKANASFIPGVAIINDNARTDLLPIALVGKISYVLRGIGLVFEVPSS